MKKLIKVPIDENVSVIRYGKWIIDKEENLFIDCYVTDDEKRLLSLRGTARVMGLSGGGSGALARNLKANYLQPFLSPELHEWIQKVESKEIKRIKNDGAAFIPFDATLLIDVCKAYNNAKVAGVFNGEQWEKQSDLADKLFALMSAVAKVGIIAFVDEITGYQFERDAKELQKLLSKYVAAEFLPWVKTFPDEFYEQMFQLRGWDYKGKAKTPYAGVLTNFLVYNRLPKGVIEELKRLNPVIKNNGYRKHRLHQGLTKKTGYNHLKQHISTVITLMKGFDTWEDFEPVFRKAFNVPEDDKL